MSAASAKSSATAFDIAGPDAVQLETLPTVSVPIRELRPGDGPRHNGLSEEHCRILVNSGDDLPPILVHGTTLRVIDGLHRVRAAALRGRAAITARVFDGPEADAFVLAVRLNILDGLPLSRAERAAAAARIVRTHPQWSDRMLAATTGLSAATIAGIRARAAARTEQSEVRVGKDGRARPVNGAVGRLRVCRLLESDPDASIREIARRAGVSPSTVHDVRRRLRDGHEPVPPRLRPPEQDTGEESEDERALRMRALFEAAAVADPVEIIAALSKDPSLRYNDSGRGLLRWLDQSLRVIAHCPDAAERIPPHSAGAVAALAREYAYAWADFASALLSKEQAPS
jgi:transposase-like protein